MNDTIAVVLIYSKQVLCENAGTVAGWVAPAFPGGVPVVLIIRIFGMKYHFNSRFMGVKLVLRSPT
ncbi:MAG: hypothetical protein RBS47_10775 [Hydrogenophaga sp.]|jgi:hypothetical protein|uniref:hypothetical protein n=1 Tax=Hydrogenophaga sp. TaxID=1904254 RepID=UPI002A35D082|nr:hypothetical protein [Hydrogenophaga sp.]MDX9969499.1 hypothetical protein [Hydrogenophaga sp.]